MSSRRGNLANLKRKDARTIWDDEAFVFERENPFVRLHDDGWYIDCLACTRRLPSDPDGLDLQPTSIRSRHQWSHKSFMSHCNGSFVVDALIIHVKSNVLFLCQAQPM